MKSSADPFRPPRSGSLVADSIQEPPPGPSGNMATLLRPSGPLLRFTVTKPILERSLFSSSLHACIYMNCSNTDSKLQADSCLRRGSSLMPRGDSQLAVVCKMTFFLKCMSVMEKGEKEREREREGERQKLLHAE